MCGIAGFISSTWSADFIHRMTDRIRHRGPDADGFYIHSEQHVCLGHRRLSILDLSEAANQPFYSKDKRYVMVFNGEVYNFRDLKTKYHLHTDTSSDTEVILELFALKGVQALQEFNGMFALAIWDTQEKKLTLIRDRFGVKPLYYYDGPEGFAFASELKALLELPIKREINREALADFMFLEYIPKPNTIFKNIFKLPNGHYAKRNVSGALQITRWYHLLSAYKPVTVSESAALDDLHDLLSSSVQYRMISDVPVGVFLSGGTDSSVVAAKFQEQSSVAVNSFTIGFDVAKFDESRYARQVAEQLKTSHHEYRLQADEMLDITKEAAVFYDEPLAGTSTLPSMLVCKNARSYATVALSGDGGDELFMGYNIYNWYARIKTLERIGGVAAVKLSGRLLNMIGERGQGAARLFEGWNKKTGFIQAWSQSQAMFTQAEISRLLNTTYTHTSTIPYWESLEKENLSDQQQISFFDMEYYLADDLMYKMDIASMRHSLEVRCPFLDYRLVEYAMNLPLELKMKNGEQKYLLKKVLEKYLPSNLIYRPKWGFPAPVSSWLTRDDIGLIDYYLSFKRIAAQGIFNPHETESLVRAYKSGKSMHTQRIWTLIVFQKWYDEYMISEQAPVAHK